ncbi:MAG: hypothetical protein WCK35_18635 [Chloroflexota bacterium]
MNQKLLLVDFENVHQVELAHLDEHFYPKIQSHRTAWLNNGWQVAEFDQQARWVRFVRSEHEH